MGDREYVLKLASEKDVKFIRLWFTDTLGFLKSFAITVEELEQALEEGCSFDGASLRGSLRAEETDMVAKPDPSTFRILPWRPTEGGAVARMFCDIYEPSGKPFEGDPRYILKRNIQKASDLGFTYYVGPELEFFYFKSSSYPPEPLDVGSYFDLTPLDMATDIRRDTVLSLEEMGIGVEYSHHDISSSQHEIGLRYTDALTMADNAMTYKVVVKEMAQKHGVYASFMPKPLQDQNGSGMHVHQSLFRGENNCFYDPNDEYRLSQTARFFMAGLLRHAREFTIITNQWVNSYKRLVPDFGAPIYVAWSKKNRPNLIKVPMFKPDKPEAARIEFRSPDPACNPYLAFSVMLAAGLKGIQERYPLPPPVEENILEMSPAEIERRGIQRLPETLKEAIDLAASSGFLRETLGDLVVDELLETKLREWRDYRAVVSRYEIEKYLPFL